MPLEITGNYLSRCTPDSAVPEITVPEGVKTIGYRAFAGCPALRFLSLPISLRQIEDHAFDQCRLLESLTVPQRVSMIGISAFCRQTTLVFRTNSTALTVPPRKSYNDSGDASVLAHILHIKNRAELPELFQSLSAFSFRAAAGIWMMQTETIKCAEDWLLQNMEHILEMYLSADCINMLHLLLNTHLLSEEMMEAAISLAIEKHNHELYMLLVNHKQDTFGITGGTGTLRL